MNTWIKPFDSGLYNDNYFMIRLNALIALFSFGYYEVHGIVFSALSFLGVLWVVQSLIKEQGDRQFALAIDILFPSSLIWLSGGLKEAILLCGIGAIIKASLHSSLTLRQRILYLFIALVILLNLKLYVAAFLIPAVALELIRRKKQWKPIWVVISWIDLGLLVISVTHLLHIPLDEYLIRKQHEFINVVQELNSGSGFAMERMSHGYTSILTSIPQSWMNTLLRPWPWEISSMPELLLGAENALLWIMIGLGLSGMIKTKGDWRTILWVLLFLVPFLTLIGLVTPVFGAIMRYRAPAILVLLIALSPYIRASVMTLLKRP